MFENQLDYRKREKNKKQTPSLCFCAPPSPARSPIACPDELTDGFRTGAAAVPETLISPYSTTPPLPPNAPRLSAFLVITFNEALFHFSNSSSSNKIRYSAWYLFTLHAHGLASGYIARDCDADYKI